MWFQCLRKPSGQIGAPPQRKRRKLLWLGAMLSSFKQRDRLSAIV
jgi:hypothetical protein